MKLWKRAMSSPWNQAVAYVLAYAFAVAVLGPLVAGFLRDYVL